MKRSIPYILIVIVLGISIYMMIEKNRDEKELSKYNLEKVSYKKESKDEANEDLKIILKEHGKDIELNIKNINYIISSFFHSINMGDFEEIEVYKDYKAFYGLSDDFLKRDYQGKDTLFYEIVDFEHLNDIYLVDIKYKEEKVNSEVKIKTFSTNGKEIIDQSYLGLEEINEVITNDFCEIEVIAKMIYSDRVVYRVEIKNNSQEVLKIDDDIWGFHGTDDLNKYYHKMLGGSDGYDILPNNNNVYFVELLGKTLNELNVNINGETINIINTLKQ